MSLVITIVFYSCKKDEIIDEPTSLLSLEGDYPPIISGNGGYGDDTVLTPTIIGNLRVNPYEVQVMRQAWNNLYPTEQIASLVPSNLYVKFTPTNVEEINLLDQTNEMLYDYPLEYKLITLGDYFPQPGRQFPELWAIVSPNFQSPISGYTVLQELFIPPYNSDITQEAFSISGNSYDPGGDPMYIAADNCCPDCPNYPDCIIIPRIGCGAEINCPHGDPGNGGSGGGDPNLKSFCGCLVYSDNRKPGGCIKVKDVEHNQFEGVKKVKVITKDDWFTENETETDEQGCWKIDNRYYNNMWMWVKFKGPICQIRGVKDGLNYVFGWTNPMKDYLGRIRIGPPYNNIEVKYDLWTVRGSQAHMHWAASTVNNAIHDFHSYALNEGINLPPWLDIFIDGGRSDGIALMANHCHLSNTSPALIGFVPYLYISTVLPDLSIGVEFKNSDQLKELAYHETSHASHFTLAGCDFWEDLMTEELDGIAFHGTNAYHQVDGIVDITEAWAFHLGWFFADKHYPAGQRSRNWEFRLEDTRNREAGHMPAGVFHDLKDLVPNGNESTSDFHPMNCCFTVIDKVNGFNCGQMFTLLGENTRSPNNFYQQFISNFGNNDPVLIQNMDDLFNSY